MQLVISHGLDKRHFTGRKKVKNEFHTRLKLVHSWYSSRNIRLKSPSWWLTNIFNLSLTHNFRLQHPCFTFTAEVFYRWYYGLLRKITFVKPESALFGYKYDFTKLYFGQGQKYPIIETSLFIIYQLTSGSIKLRLTLSIFNWHKVIVRK